MKKILSMIAVLSTLSLVLVTGSQANPMGQSGFTTYDTTKLIGLTVKARDGVPLGQIFDFVVDSRGHIDFAIVNQFGSYDFPGRAVVVPFSLLMISKAKPDEISVVFNADKEKFYEGPDWGYENLANAKQAASVDRYYGIQPYWTKRAEKESKLEKYDRMFEKVDEAKRDALELASLVSVGYVAANSLTKCSTEKHGFMDFDMYGVPVRNPEGELLGSITDILMSQREPDNVIAVLNIGSSSDYSERLWYGDSGGLTLVPMTALKFSETKSGKPEFVMMSTEAKLEAAPFFDATKIDNPQYDIQLYRHYGVQPYWTEECVPQGK
jgi:ribosomal 30S subunit maturation factor RimM